MQAGPLILVIPAAFLLALAAACDTDETPPAPTPTLEGDTITPAPDATTPGRDVVIDSISPSGGPLGSEAVLHGSGFTPEENDIGFTHPEIDFQGQDTGYLNGVSSPDDETLRFNLPDNDGVLLSACAFSQLGPDGACPAIGIFLPLGETEVFVVNERGESNRVTFSVSDDGGEEPER